MTRTARFLALLTFAIIALLTALPAAAQHDAQPAHTEPANTGAQATPDAAAHDEHASGEPVGVNPTVKQAVAPAVTALLVFAVVLAILATKVWPKISKGLSDREDKIRSEIESAEMARQQAKEALDEYQRSLAQARAEAQKMIEHAKVQQLAVAAELRAKSDVDLAALREKAMKDIESAKRAAVSEIYEHSAHAAVQMAGKILGREINPGDQRRFVEESMAHLQTVRN